MRVESLCDVQQRRGPPRTLRFHEVFCEHVQQASVTHTHTVSRLCVCY